MVDERLIDYIKKGLSRGIPIEKIKEELLEAKWKEEDVNEAIYLVKQEMGPEIEEVSPEVKRKKFAFLKKISEYPKELSIVVISIALLIVIFMAASILFGEKTLIHPPEPTECENDISCFIEASAGCKLAKLSYNAEFYEIKGMMGNKCVLYKKNEETGKDGVCKFNTPDLTSFLYKLQEGSLSGSVSCNLVTGEWKCTSSGDYALGDCKGEIFVS